MGSKKGFPRDPQLKQHFHVKTGMAEAVLHPEELQQVPGSSTKKTQQITWSLMHNKG